MARLRARRPAGACLHLREAWVLTTQRRPAVTEQPREHEQADGEGDPSPHVAEVGDPGNTDDLAGGEAAGGVHAERKDSGPAAHIVAEPGPEDLAGDQGKEPHHGRHHSTRVPSVRIWCCSPNCPSARAASVILPAARAEMASAPPATQWSPWPVSSSRRSNRAAVKT